MKKIILRVSYAGLNAFVKSLLITYIYIYIYHSSYCIISASRDTPQQKLEVLPDFGNHYSCHLQGKCLRGSPKQKINLQYLTRLTPRSRKFSSLSYEAEACLNI